MPEGDTVFRTCVRLHEALAGRELLAAELRWPGLSTAQLAGMQVVEVLPRGKHILIRLDSGWTLHSHLRMEGQWRIERAELRGDPSARSLSNSGRGTSQERHEAPPSSPWPSTGPTLRGASPTSSRGFSGITSTEGRDVRAILVTEPWTALGLRLGMLDLVRTSAEHTLIGHLGPDILDDAFDLDRAVSNLAGSGTSVGAALLDQRNLAGIGTLWSSEALFAQRLSPWASAAALSAAQLTALVERARRLMIGNLPYVVQSTTGSRRKGENTYVHARSGRPCRRCGSTVRVAPIGPPTRERTMFYCPRCQGGLAPTDDGRPIGPLGSGRRGGRAGRGGA